MKTLTSLTLATVLLLGLSTATFAAKGANRPEAGRGMERLKTELTKLDLSDDQTKKCSEVIDDATQKIQDVMKDGKGGDKAAAKEKIKPIVKETMQKLLAELTPDQKTKFRDAVQQMRAQRKGRAAGAEKSAGATTQPAA